MLFNGKFAFYQFSMLFNGNFAFNQFTMLFNKNLRLEKLWGEDGRTDVRTYGRMEIHPCVLQDIGPLGPLPKKVMKSSCIISGFQLEICSKGKYQLLL